MDLNDPEFRELAVQGAELVRDELRSLLDAAVDAGELSNCDTKALARAIQAIFNGSIVFWAIYRKGRAETWVRRDLETVLEPFRRKRRKR
jgi:surface antigen